MNQGIVFLHDIQLRLRVLYENSFDHYIWEHMLSL